MRRQGVSEPSQQRGHGKSLFQLSNDHATFPEAVEKNRRIGKNNNNVVGKISLGKEERGAASCPSILAWKDSGERSRYFSKGRIKGA